MLVRLTVQTIVWFGFIGAVLFLSAGTLAWPAAWIYLFLMLALSLLVGLLLARHDPALLKERLAAPIQEGQPLADKVLLSVILLFLVAGFAFMALDAARFKWSSMPVWVQALGALLVVLSVGFSYRTLRENSFASPVVKVQSERAQSVITTGPYRYVRHPFYTGSLLFVAATSLFLGSWWGLLVALGLAALLAIRIGIEEKALRAGLAGYGAYAERVRYRLVPYVW